jgi:hypothetical protein
VFANLAAHDEYDGVQPANCIVVPDGPNYIKACMVMNYAPDVEGGAIIVRCTDGHGFDNFTVNHIFDVVVGGSVFEIDFELSIIFWDLDPVARAYGWKTANLAADTHYVSDHRAAVEDAILLGEFRNKINGHSDQGPITLFAMGKYPSAGYADVEGC